MVACNSDIIIAFRIWAKWQYPGENRYNVTHMLAFKCFLGQKHDSTLEGHIIDGNDPVIAARIERILNSGQHTNTILHMMKIKFDGPPE